MVGGTRDVFLESLRRCVVAFHPTLVSSHLARAGRIAMFALLVTVTACGEAPEPEPAATNAALPASAPNGAPPEAVRPAALEGEALVRTAQLFDATCATCHLRSGKGDPHHEKDDIPDFTDRAWQSTESDEALRDAIVNGSGTVMPPFGTRLSGEQIDELVTYVRGFPDRPPPAAEKAGPMRHDESAKKPAPRKTAGPRAPARKPAKPAAPKEDHSGHGDHPDD